MVGTVQNKYKIYIYRPVAQTFELDQPLANSGVGKGLGNWTVDVYLILILHRPDHFPFGDIAAVNALKQLKGLPKDTPDQILLDIVTTWRPYRTVTTMLLWHYYLSLRGRTASWE